MALHIRVGQQNVVGWQLLFIYLGTPTTHYSLEYNERTTYVETHPWEHGHGYIYIYIWRVYTDMGDMES
jgi:hypothetical protein